MLLMKKSLTNSVNLMYFELVLYSMNDLPKHVKCKAGQHQDNIMESIASNFNEVVRTYQ